MISHKHKCIFVHIPKNAGSSVEKAFGFSEVYHQGTARHAPVWSMLGFWQTQTNYKEYPLSVERGKKKLFPRCHHDGSYAMHFDEYPKFAICRNPWDRLVSTWKYDQKLLNAVTDNSLVATDSSASLKWLRTRRDFYKVYLDEIGNDFGNFVKNLYTGWFGALGKRDWVNLSPKKNPPNLPVYLWIKWHMHSQMTFIVDEKNNVRVDDILRFENLSEDWDKLCEKHGWDLELPHTNKSSGKHYTEYYDDETRDMVARRYATDIEYFDYKFGG